MKVDEINRRLKNYSHHKDINKSNTEDHLRSIKSHLNKRSMSLLVKNVLKYLIDSFWNDAFLKYAVESDECKFELPSKSPNVISVGNIGEVS